MKWIIIVSFNSIVITQNDIIYMVLATIYFQFYCYYSYELGFYEYHVLTTFNSIVITPKLIMNLVPKPTIETFNSIVITLRVLGLSSLVHHLVEPFNSIVITLRKRG